MQERNNYLKLPITFAIIFISCQVLYRVKPFNTDPPPLPFEAIVQVLPHILHPYFLFTILSLMAIILLFSVQYKRGQLSLSSMLYISVLTIANFIIINELSKPIALYLKDNLAIEDQFHLYRTIDFIIYGLLIAVNTLISHMYFKGDDKNTGIISNQKSFVIILCYSILANYIVFNLLLDTKFFREIISVFYQLGFIVAYFIGYGLSLLIVFTFAPALCAGLTSQDDYATKVPKRFIYLVIIICVLLFLWVNYFSKG